MFKEIRRTDRALPEDAMLEIMDKAEYGILSTLSESGYPYGVPVSFVFFDNVIYFHCALEGHKLDNIALNIKVSFCVVTDVSLMPGKFSTKYRSVVAFGQVSEVPEDRKEDVFVKILEKFSHEHMEAGMQYIKNSGAKARLFQIEVLDMKAKGRR